MRRITTALLGLTTAAAAATLAGGQVGATATARAPELERPASYGAADPTCPRFRPDGALATPEQLRLERLALKLTETPAVRAEAQALRDYYAGTALASTPSGAATLEAAVRSVTLGAAEEAVLLDPERPAFMWTVTAAHCWFNQPVPNSGYGIENPDNAYRHVGVDDTSSYVVHGRLPENAPMDLSFLLYGGIPGTGPLTQEGGAPILGSLTLAQMEVGPDGTFVVTVGPDAADGRPNHIRTQAGAELLIVRDSLSDWATESPTELTITRQDGPEVQPRPSFRELATRAALLTSQLGRYWGVDYNREFMYSRPANYLVPSPRQRAFGFATSGHFNLGADQALVVTVDPKGARYVGFQLADPWGVALEYVGRAGSLNRSQAKANLDGTITYVVSAADPGVWNWLDTSGLSSGIMAARWQGVPVGEDSYEAVRSVTVVDLADLPGVLPEGTTLVDAPQRAEQLQERSTTYLRRLSQ